MGDERFPNGTTSRMMKGGYPAPQFHPDPIKSPAIAKLIADYRRKWTEVATATPALRSQMIRGGYPQPRFTPDPMQSPSGRKLIDDYRRKREDAAAARLLPSNRFTDVLGKVWTSPFTVVGSVAGAANVGIARAMGDERAGISMRDNGIQFESGYFGDEKSAFTLGNAVLHGPGSRADLPVEYRYDKQKSAATMSEHESGHTYQYPRPGFVADYIRYLVREYLNGEPNPYEREADDFGDWKRRRRGGGW